MTRTLALLGLAACGGGGTNTVKSGTFDTAPEIDEDPPVITHTPKASNTSHTSHNRSAADWWGSGDLKSGVYFFRQLTGRRVFNVALTAYKAAGAQGDWLEPRAADSMDKALHDAGHRLAWFPADAAFLSKHLRWWLQNGNAAGMENGIHIVPRDHFDAYVYIDHSPLQGLLPARPVWQP